jgi:hypothetical protein
MKETEENKTLFQYVKLPTEYEDVTLQVGINIIIFIIIYIQKLGP